jgi:hypothetical protein
MKLYEIEQQQLNLTTKLLQTFPKEHSSDSCISSLIQINPNTLVSSSYQSSSSSDNVIVIWSKSKPSSSLYEPLQRITKKETGGGGIDKLVLITQKKEEEEEEEFASCSKNSIIIWRRGKEEEFQIKQKITKVKDVKTLLYISLTNELISGSFSFDSPLQIWSPSPSSSSSSSSSSDFVERQTIQRAYNIESLCQINRNDSRSRIEFASGHLDGQIMIWSKQINESNYSLIRTLQPHNIQVDDLIFINDNGFDFLISCSWSGGKIVIYKGEEEEEEKEELEHKRVLGLIPMSNGQFASGGAGANQCLNIWTPSSSSSLSTYF